MSILFLVYSLPILGVNFENLGCNFYLKPSSSLFPISFIVNLSYDKTWLSALTICSFTTTIYPNTFSVFSCYEKLPMSFLEIDSRCVSHLSFCIIIHHFPNNSKNLLEVWFHKQTFGINVLIISRFIPFHNIFFHLSPSISLLHTSNSGVSCLNFLFSSTLSQEIHQLCCCKQISLSAFTFNCIFPNS